MSSHQILQFAGGDILRTGSYALVNWNISGHHSKTIRCIIYFKFFVQMRYYPIKTLIIEISPYEVSYLRHHGIMVGNANMESRIPYVRPRKVVPSGLLLNSASLETANWTDGVQISIALTILGDLDDDLLHPKNHVTQCSILFKIIVIWFTLGYVAITIPHLFGSSRCPNPSV